MSPPRDQGKARVRRKATRVRFQRQRDGGGRERKLTNLVTVSKVNDLKEVWRTRGAV